MSRIAERIIWSGDYINPFEALIAGLDMATILNTGQGGTGQDTSAWSGMVGTRAGTYDRQQGALLVKAPTGNSTTDTASLIDAISALPSSRGKLLLQDGTYMINDELALTGSGSYTLEGTSVRGTKLQWDGGAATPLLSYAGLYFCKLVNVQLIASSASPCLSAIELKSGCSELQFDNVFINGTSTTTPYGFTYGFNVSGATACDAIIYQGVRLSGCEYGYYSTGGQARLNTWITPNFINNGYAVYWDVTGGGYGPFTMLDPFFSGSATCDINCAAGTDSLNIIGGRGEGSTRFLETNDTGYPFPVTIQGFTWASNALHADDIALNYMTEGQCTLIGCRFGAAGTQSPVILAVKWGRLNLVGSILRADSDVLPITVSGTGDVQSINNRRMDNAGVHTWFTDRVIYRGLTQGTVGAAGGASALPATPTGYKEIIIAGTAYVVPYYAKA